MAVTQFGIVYSIQSAQIRRYIYPTLNNSEIALAELSPGEAVTPCSIGPYMSTAAWQAAVISAVNKAAGKPPGNPTCCVLDNANIVVEIILADALIDSLPGMTLVQAYAKIPLGSTYDPATGLFTAPGYTVPAYPGNGSDRPPAAAVVVPPTVIPKP